MSTEATEAAERDFRRAAVLGSGMRVTRCLTAIVSVVLLLPAGAAAATPQIYLGSRPD